MHGSPNIYATVAFDLNPKVSDFIDSLNREGQIDLDDSGQPYLFSVDRHGPNFVAKIRRNGKVETFILNPRKKTPPKTTWNSQDGFHRPERAAPSANPAKNSRRERARRDADVGVYESIVEAIMKG